MNKKDILNSTSKGLQNWLDEFKAHVIANKILSEKMREFLFRKMDEASIESLAVFLKSRTNIILYLNDAGDFTETQVYSHEETEQAVALLTPDDFDADKDCIYCLKSLPTNAELQKHYETCAV